MARSVSRWRRMSREVIESVLLGVPNDADEKTVRAALSDAYPFGERKMHPYKVWLAEVRRAVEARFTKPERKADEPAVRYAMTNYFWLTPFWLTVECDWCGSTVKGGCMMCCAHWRRLEHLLGHDVSLKGLLAAVREGDAASLPVLADWCEENLGFRPDKMEK